MLRFSCHGLSGGCECGEAANSANFMKLRTSCHETLDYNSLSLYNEEPNLICLS